MTKTLSNEHNLQVLYEDNHLIAFNKRPGDIVQVDKTVDKPLSEVVKDYIKWKYKKPGNVFLGVAHRLDRPTSGVVVFARTSKALARLNKLFAGKETSKTYWALVKSKPPSESGTLVHWLKKNPKQNKSYPHANEVSGSKKAILDYHLKKSL
ncbi:MAG: RNA pseudouridine synthase, partial [Eudoraea sp.]|nr:RNA pseudouridine synthase [Eudoraea sp.]